MNKIWGFLKLLAAGLIGGSLVWLAGSYDMIRFPNAYSMVPMATLEITNTDFITIMLTSVTVVLAAVGIGVGVVAAYTIRNLREDAEKKVDTAFKHKFEKVEEQIQLLAYNVGKNLDNDYIEEDMEDR